MFVARILLLALPLALVAAACSGDDSSDPDSAAATLGSSSTDTDSETGLTASTAEQVGSSTT